MMMICLGKWYQVERNILKKKRIFLEKSRKQRTVPVSEGYL